MIEKIEIDKKVVLIGDGIIIVDFVIMMKGGT
jgi:hypothetical protein